MGLKNLVMDVINWKEYKYCVVAMVKNQTDNFLWKNIVVYVTPYDDTKFEIIDELDVMMGEWQGPSLVWGGGFNLVRYQNEKSNGLINHGHADRFNGWIHKWGLMDIKDPSRSFTWSNNQRCPILAVLDRTLISVELGIKYPTTKMVMLPKEASDHNPLLLDLGGQIQIKDPMFHFGNGGWRLRVLEKLLRKPGKLSALTLT
jgi:hypothetical protein